MLEGTEITRWNGEAWEWCGEIEGVVAGDKWATEDSLAAGFAVAGDFSEGEEEAITKAVLQGKEEVTVGAARFRVATQEEG